jgi:hypothetical protein
MPIRPAELGDREVDELDRRLQDGAREQREGCRHSAPERHSSWNEGQLREDQSDEDPGDFRMPELVGDRPESDLGELADQKVGADCHQCRGDEVARAQPA